GARGRVVAYARRRRALPGRDRPRVPRPPRAGLAPHAWAPGRDHVARRRRAVRRPSVGPGRRGPAPLGRRGEGGRPANALAGGVGAADPARSVAVSPLADAQVTAELAQTPGWKRAGKAIERTYRF